MNNRSAALAAVLLAAAAAQARSQAVELRFKPVVGQVSHYTMVNQVWMGGDTSAAPMQSTMYQTRTVTAMDGANFVVKTVTDSTVMPAGSPGAGRDIMRGMGVTQTMDARGHILKTEVTPPPGLPPFVANMMTRNNQQGNSNRGQITWPEGPVSPGYTWTDTIVQ